MRYVPEWFPGGGFHKEARQWRKMVSEAVNTPYEFVLEHMVCFFLHVLENCTLMLAQAKGDAAPSLTSRVLQEGVTAEDEEILKWTSFGMYLGMISSARSRTVLLKLSVAL